jgi:hypothetical protein
MNRRQPIKNVKSLDEIPNFPNEQAEAEFWQSHSPVELLDQLPQAEEVKFTPVPKRLIPLPLEEKVYRKVRQMARQRGISPLTFIQRLIEGRLRNRKAFAKKNR